MAFSFDSTVGGASANSYVTVAEMSDYCGGRLDATEFDATVTLTQQKSLVMATARLDQENYVGTPAAFTQRLKFPRLFVPSIYGSWEDSDVIPERIKQATYELAIALLKDTTLFRDSGLEAFEQVGVGPLAVTPRVSRKAGTLPQQVIRLLSDLRTSGGGQTYVVRG